MTPTDAINQVRAITTRAQRLWPSMDIHAQRSQSDGLEVRVRSGDGDARYGVVMVLDRDLPRLDKHAVEAIVVGLIRDHVDDCLRGRT